MTTPDVLIVDDEPSIRMLTARWLEEAGYLVQGVATADAAIKAVADRAPQVLVTDINMPGHDGVWLARQLRTISPETALVMISGDPAAGPEVARANLGAFDYLEKPFTVIQLTEAVDRGMRWSEARVIRRRLESACGRGASPGIWSSEDDDLPGEWTPSERAADRLLADLAPAR